jgi:predicted peptidase
LDAYVLAPQCQKTNIGISIVPIDFKIKSAIDSNRIYLTDLSMGGWGAWNLALLILKCSPL